MNKQAALKENTLVISEQDSNEYNSSEKKQTSS